LVTSANRHFWLKGGAPMKHVAVYIQVNGELRKARRLPWDRNYPDTIAFAVEGETLQAITAFSTLNSEAFCTCGRRAFGECLHARALRRASLTLNLTGAQSGA
jgi:hypothetical protein